MKPTQLGGLPITRVAQPTNGSTAPPDRRKWHRPLSLSAYMGPLPESFEPPVRALREGDLVALRWPDGWKIAERWRPEREGILCVLAEGGSIWVSDAKGIMILHEEDVDRDA
jgi:hypothetical protein